MKNHSHIVLKMYNHAIITIFGYIKITKTAKFFNKVFFINIYLLIFIFYYNT